MNSKWSSSHNQWLWLLFMFDCIYNTVVCSRNFGPTMPAIDEAEHQRFSGRNGRAFDFTTHNNNNQSHYNAHRTYWARLMYTSICNSNGMDRCDPFNGPLTRHYSIFCVALHNWYVRIVCGRWHAWVSMTLMRSNTVECISNPLLFMSIRAFAVLFLLYIMEEYWRLQCLSMRR